MKNLHKYVISFVSSTLFASIVAVMPQPAFGQEIGAWETSSNNAGFGAQWNATNSVWQTNTGSGYVIPGGNTDGISYPDTNTTTVTLLPGAFVTNSGAISVNQLTVSNGAVLGVGSTMSVLHNPATTYDWDIFGGVAITTGTQGAINLNNAALITVENGGAMTNFTFNTHDLFENYTNANILFTNGSLYVMSGAGAATGNGTFPQATWAPNSITMYMPSAAGTKFPLGITNQTFGNFVWNYPLQSGSIEPSSKFCNFTASTFAIYTANSDALEDVPGPGQTLTAGNILITNATWEPSPSAGTTYINIGGNFIIDSTATLNMGSSSSFGYFTFDGTAPQTLAIYGKNSSASAFNWTVASGATVELGTNLMITVNGTEPAGTFTNNGWFDLESYSLNDASNLCGVGIITNSTGSNTLFAGSGVYTGKIVGGTGTISVEKVGTATWTLPGANTYSGSTIVNAGTLALTGSASIADSSNITIRGGSTFDVSGLSSTFTLGAAQTIGNTSSNTATINGAVNASLGTVTLAYTSTPSIMITGGALTLASGTRFNVNNTGTALAAGTYILITNSAGGSVSGTLPSVSVIGNGLAASESASLQLNSGVLDLVVTAQSTPKFTGISVSGTTLTISATNGADGGQYVLWGTTNLVPPVVWMPIFTNNYSGSGSINLSTNVVNPSVPWEFYQLR